MKKNNISRLKNLVSKGVLDDLENVESGFKSIERVVISMVEHLGEKLPSDVEPTLIGQIIKQAIFAYKQVSNEGYDEKYKAFLSVLVSELRQVATIKVTERENPLNVWNCFGESFEAWSSSVVNFDVERVKIDYGVDDMLGMLVAGNIFERRDWHFLGIPHPGKVTALKLVNNSFVNKQVA